MMRNLRVITVREGRFTTAGYRVAFDDMVDSDSPIEAFYHFALFADRRDAEDLLARVRAAGYSKLDLRACWVWNHDSNQVTGLAICGELPRAELETVARLSARGVDVR
jgi:hypothetical protein